MTTLVADLEADGFLQDMTTIWCLTIKDRETGERQTFSDHSANYPSLREGVDWLSEADQAVFHNGLGYDAWALLNMGFEIDHKKILDTLVISRLIDPQMKAHSLKAWGERLGNHKGDWTDFSRFDEEMLRYCEQDVEVTDAIYSHLMPQMQQHSDQAIRLEHDVAWIIEMQRQNGFRLDVAACHELVGELLQEREDHTRALREIFPPIFIPEKKGEVITPKVNNAKRGITKGHPYCKVKVQVFNPGSDQQKAERLKRLGWKPKEFTPTGQPKVGYEILASLPFDEAKALARYDRIEKMLGQITGSEGWFKHLQGERVHGSVNTNGARTGRMTHFAPNMAQVDKKEPRMRAVWIPRAGWMLVGCDAEGLEARMLAHYLAKYDKGRYGKAVHEGNSKDGTDVHTMNQKAAGLHLRNSAKRLLYAMMYGGGDAKLGKIVVEDALEAGHPKPKGSLKDIGASVRAALMKGVLGLDKVIEGVQFKAQKRGWLKGLDGRRIICPEKRLALNTLLQGAGAIVMKHALVVFHERAEHEFGAHGSTWAYCANVHDEVQIECQPEIAEQIGQSFADSITQAGIDLNVRCPLVGSYIVGSNWKETH